jgi:putative ABC transport system permease protein
LRGMLAMEAMLLAAAGALVGIIAGVGFGMIGTAAAAKNSGMTHVRFDVSVPQTLLVVAIALAAGVVASILPARRAARSAPTEALADA